MAINGDGNELLLEGEFENSDTNSLTGLLDAVFKGLVVAELSKSVGLIRECRDYINELRAFGPPTSQRTPIFSANFFKLD